MILEEDMRDCEVGGDKDSGDDSLALLVACPTCTDVDVVVAGGGGSIATEDVAKNIEGDRWGDARLSCDCGEDTDTEDDGGGDDPSQSIIMISQLFYLLICYTNLLSQSQLIVYNDDEMMLN